MAEQKFKHLWVTPDVKPALESVKIISKEPYSDVILRLVRHYQATKQAKTE